MKKVKRIYEAREKKLTQEVDRKARKRRKLAKGAQKVAQQDGRTACEPIEEMLDEYSSYYGYDN